MARSEQVDGLQPRSRIQPQYLAWAVLLTAFFTFCLISTATTLSLWSYITRATVSREAALYADVPAGVTYQPHGSTSFFSIDSGGRGILGENYRVRVAPASSAGYGKVASIELFDGSSLDIRAGTEVMLDTYRSSRWTLGSQTVVIGQLSGYVRYNLAAQSNYALNTFSVDLHNGTTIDLQAGGSYSIQVRPPSRLLLLANRSAPRVMPDSRVEVAVRGQGLATIRNPSQRVQVRPGELAVIESGMPQPPVPALWELIRDRHFSRFSAQAYNNTTIIAATPTLTRSDTWIVYGQATGDVTRAKDRGQFSIANECLSDQPRENCSLVTSAQLIRTGGQTQGFITGIYQNLGDPIAVPSGPAARDPDQETGPQRGGVDVSEYARLQFSADLRILNQSLDKGGQAGTECPLLIRFLYKQRSPADEQLRQEFCFWYKDGPAGTLVQATYFKTQHVPQYEWVHFTVDLRDGYLPEARFIQRIEIEARGHDYNTEITNISLVGAHS